MTKLHDLINTDPDMFMSILSAKPDGFTLATAEQLDQDDPLSYLPAKFQYGSLTPFAGHSLGPVFTEGTAAIDRIHQLQAEHLHDGHFSKTREQGGNWFDCDRDPDAIKAIQPMLGFEEDCEFIYTQEGLSLNLGRLLLAFYRPTKTDWQTGKTGICYLGKEFFSDQAIIHSVLNIGIHTADDFRLFAKGRRRPDPDELCFKIQPDARGIYHEDVIIDFVKKHAPRIRILHLSDIVFSTGQRLDITRILTELTDTLQHHNILVGLDLAHTAGNRPVDLKSLPVAFAVGCAYKHISGSAGSGLGIYVSKRLDMKKYPTLQGWKAAISDKVFPVIDGYNKEIMSTESAVAFRCSNPAPTALAPAQQFMKTMHEIGWDRLMARSESLTRYMLALLQEKLNDKIEFITPLDPKHRGAMLVFRIKDIQHVEAIEALLKAESPLGQYEIDTRPPNNIRVTAHYGYTRFADIHRMVTRLDQVISQQLMLEQNARLKSPAENSMFALSEPATPSAPEFSGKLQAKL